MRWSGRSGTIEAKWERGVDGMSEYKRWLSLDEQIAQLKVKGVQFSIMDENAARDYLFRQNNYFRITAYRRNFQRHPGGPKNGAVCATGICLFGGSRRH